MNITVLCICLAVLIPAADQLTKYLVRTFMALGDTVPVIKDFFHITYILNDGMAFGSMGGSFRWVFMVITPLALAAVAVYLFKNIRKISRWSAVALTMVFAGGLSNMIDRIFFIHLDPSSSGLFDGRVIDFIDFRGIWPYVFNVADAFVVVGIFLFMAVTVIEMVKESREKKQNEAALAETAAGEQPGSEDPSSETAAESDSGDKT